MSDIRNFAIAVLDDERGINELAWQKLVPLLLADEESDNKDVINAVEATDGRYFLHEDMFKAE